MSIVSTPLLNHDDLRRWRACTRRFWLHRRLDPGAAAASAKGDARAEVDSDVSAEAAVIHGPGIDAALRASFPGANVIVAPTTPAEWTPAMRRTLDCLGSARVAPEGWAILGACLTSEDRAQVRIDVLSCGERGLRLFKVRYATVGDEADVDAVALWTHVAARCGLRVQSVGLLLVDTDFIYPGHGCYAGLFREVDLAPVLGSRPVAAWLAAMRDCARGTQPPASPGLHCTQSGGCEFVHDCQAWAQTASALAPEPQASQKMVVRAIQQGTPVLEPEVAALMHALPYPRHSLRFDTIGFAVPVWAGTRPYQVLPFQWTCDVQSAAGDCARHGFLADADGDPRRAFAQTLLQALGGNGPVFAYNAGFERNRIRELAQHFDDLAPALEAVLPRIVDLFQLARTHYYHPAMAGSWSFKSISRAVAPDLPVDMDGADSPSAQATFARSLQRGLDAQTRQQLRAALQTHGQRQTEVLRRMAALFEAATAEGN